MHRWYGVWEAEALDMANAYGTYWLDTRDTLIRDELIRDVFIRHFTHCNTLQHTATHCNTLQHTATHCRNITHQYDILTRDKGRRRPIECVTLQVIFRQRATNCRALLREMAYHDKASYGSSILMGGIFHSCMCMTYWCMTYWWVASLPVWHIDGWHLSFLYVASLPVWHIDGWHLSFLYVCVCVCVRACVCHDSHMCWDALCNTQTTTHCNTLQHTHCNTLQHTHSAVLVCTYSATHMLQHTCCNTHYTTLQQTLYYTALLKLRPLLVYTLCNTQRDRERERKCARAHARVCVRDMRWIWYIDHTLSHRWCTHAHMHAIHIHTAKQGSKSEVQG